MKNGKSFLLATIISASTVMSHAQEKDQDNIKRIVEEPNYVFVAQKVSPVGKGTRILTSEYDVTFTKDTIISALPYFGRSYTATIGSTEGGINFTSTKFEYTRDDKKGKWSITIKPQDVSEVQSLYLEIFDNGNASLQVTSTNRQSISFDGYIKEGKPRGKKAF